MKGFRKFLTDQVSSIDALLAGDLSDALKPPYKALRDKFAAGLATLPEDDSKELDSSGMLALLSSANTFLVSVAAGQNAVVANVNKVWEGRIAAGEFVPKDKHAQLCGEAAEAARAAGVKEGRAAAETEFNTRLEGERKAHARAQSVAKNGLPPAPDDVLRLADAEFDTRQTQAKDRLERATKAGFDPNAKIVGRYAWAPPSDAEALEEVFRPKPGNPLQGSGAGSGGGNGGGDPKVQFAL